MKTLAQFKSENNIQSIQLFQGKGRKFANVGNISLVVSKTCDMSKPLYVSGLNKFVDPTKPELGSVAIADAYVIHNMTAVAVDTI